MRKMRMKSKGSIRGRLTDKMWVSWNVPKLYPHALNAPWPCYIIIRSDFTTKHSFIQFVKLKRR
jgi:hypothetical protein